jgi:hypothetical protein
MEQKNWQRQDLLKAINNLEEELGEPKRTTNMSLSYGFNQNYWRPKLVKKVGAVLDVNLLPFVKEVTVRPQFERINRQRLKKDESD